MKKNYIIFLYFSILIVWMLPSGGCSTTNEGALPRKALKTMQKATRYFRKEVSTNGGYLFNYKTDFTMREGEEIATPTTIWLEPPGTPGVGLVYFDAYNATGDTLYLNCAIAAARALAWGQISSGGWGELIDFDPVESKKYHYRRDVEAGDTANNRRRNYSTLDDNKTQSALELLMKIDKTLEFKDAEIHRAAIYGLDALIKVQYPNGAWPQGFNKPPDPTKFPVKKAQYPATWSHEYTGIKYDKYYTFNDNSMSDDIRILIDAYRTYGDDRYLNSAIRCGDFMILAQMPEPQPAWAQQYNTDMEPAWARKFEPPAITGYESFSVMRSLLDLYVDTGEPRFLEPVPKAIRWAESSLLPGNRLARFYELKTNKPLYFNAPRRYSNLPKPAFPDLKDYTLIYEDTDLPNHYSFQRPGESIERIKSYYNRILEKGRDTILADRKRIPIVNPDKIREIVNSLDDQGRWVEKGRLKTRDPENPYIVTDIISTRTFNRNMSLLTDYIRGQKK